MVALAAVGRHLHLAQEGVHFGRRQVAPGAHARMTGQGTADAFDALLQGRRVAPFGELIGKDLEKWAGVIKTAGIKGE